jgi:hypothetical protein
VKDLEKTSRDASESISKETEGSRQVIDLETAFSYIFPNLDKDVLYRKEFGEEKEVVGKNGLGDDVWINFRAGDQGDVFAMNSLFPKRKYKANLPVMSKRRRQENAEQGIIRNQSANRKELSKEDEIDYDTNMELKLASGFGDEQTLPAFHVIIVELCQMCTAEEKCAELKNELKKDVAAAATFTLDWDRKVRVLRVHLFGIDEYKCGPFMEIVRRRLLLRISGLGLATGCGAVCINGKMMSGEHKKSESSSKST